MSILLELKSSHLNSLKTNGILHLRYTILPLNSETPFLGTSVCGVDMSGASTVSYIVPNLTNYRTSIEEHIAKILVDSFRVRVKKKKKQKGYCNNKINSSKIIGRDASG